MLNHLKYFLLTVAVLGFVSGRAKAEEDSPITKIGSGTVFELLVDLPKHTNSWGHEQNVWIQYGQVVSEEMGHPHSVDFEQPYCMIDKKYLPLYPIRKFSLKSINAMRTRTISEPQSAWVTLKFGDKNGVDLEIECTKFQVSADEVMISDLKRTLSYGFIFLYGFRLNSFPLPKGEVFDSLLGRTVTFNHEFTAGDNTQFTIQRGKIVEDVDLRKDYCVVTKSREIFIEKGLRMKAKKVLNEFLLFTDSDSKHFYSSAVVLESPDLPKGISLDCFSGRPRFTPITLSEARAALGRLITF